MDGYSYSEMRKKVRDLMGEDSGILPFRIVFGTRDKLFHLVQENDRDFELFGIEPDVFMRMSESQAIDKMSGSRMISMGGRR
jgi:hypothetical protein